MAYNHEYPYTDPNRHNSDWEINTVKELQQKVAEFDVLAAQIIAALQKVEGFDSRLTALEAMKEEVDSLVADVATLKLTNSELLRRISALEAQFASITSLIDSAVAVEAARRYEEDTKLRVEINQLRISLDARIDDLEAAIEQLLPVDLYNRVAGKRLDLERNNYNIYEDLRYFGFNNAELASFGGSNEEVASRVHDNRDYALNAKKRYKRGYVYAPDGRRKALTNALSDIIVIIKGGASNEALAAYMLAQSLTNEDLADVISTNFGRFSALI